MSLKIDSVARVVGSEVEDVYGRVLGVLVSVVSDVDGNVRYIEVKVVDRGLEEVPGERLSFRDGKLVVTPEWRYEAQKTIEALDRAYRRRKAVESFGQGDIPGEIVEELKRSLSEEIKNLKVRAEGVKNAIRERINAIDEEAMHISKAIIYVQTLYFSGELSEKNYTQSINHLKKLREKLIEEKNDAKRVLEKLEKTIEAATAPLEVKKEQPKQEQQAPQPIMVKVEEG
ncbi:MAG: CdvA-like protein [Acidilobaceae archaeon]|nr:CdvA-like protein [Acidilobaceae archaeon]